MATVKNEHTRDEILNALQVIKDVCNLCENCETCPLRDCDAGDECTLQNVPPCDWRIKQSDGMWRAFG